MNFFSGSSVSSAMRPFFWSHFSPMNYWKNYTRNMLHCKFLFSQSRNEPYLLFSPRFKGRNKPTDLGAQISLLTSRVQWRVRCRLPQTNHISGVLPKEIGLNVSWAF